MDEGYLMREKCAAIGKAGIKSGVKNTAFNTEIISKRHIFTIGKTANYEARTI